MPVGSSRRTQSAAKYPHLFTKTTPGWGTNAWWWTVSRIAVAVGALDLLRPWAPPAPENLRHVSWTFTTSYADTLSRICGQWTNWLPDGRRTSTPDFEEWTACGLGRHAGEPVVKPPKDSPQFRRTVEPAWCRAFHAVRDIPVRWWKPPLNSMWVKERGLGNEGALRRTLAVYRRSLGGQRRMFAVPRMYKISIDDEYWYHEWKYHLRKLCNILWRNCWNH